MGADFKLVKMEFEVPSTQALEEFRGRLEERMGWPDATVAQKAKAAGTVEVESRNLKKAIDTLATATDRIDQLEALSKELVSRDELARLLEEVATENKRLQKALAHTREDLEELRSQWVASSTH